LTARSADGRGLAVATVGSNGIAKFHDVDPEQVESLVWAGARADGWQKEVESAWQDGEAETVRVEHDSVLLDGVLATGHAGRTPLLIRGRMNGRTVTYKHDFLTADDRWQVRVESGLEYELLWRLAEDEVGVRKSVGDRIELGLITQDRRLVVGSETGR
jgi:hypothetical protein